LAQTHQPVYTTSGSDRRYITNHVELASALSEQLEGRFASIVLERTSIYYQYYIFKHAKVVLAQHGAALANIFFMQQSAYVIEFSPPWSRTSHYFKNLAEFCKVRYLQLMQEADIAP